MAAFEKLQREGDSVRYSFEDVRSQLFSVVKSLSSVYILIDDLDGMYHNQRRQLFRTLIDLVDPKSSLSVVKIMVSSRPKDDIPTSLGVFLNISVNKADTNLDVEILIRSKIKIFINAGKPLRSCLEADPELERLIIDKLISQADGR